jgi:hypothetical protein
MRGRTSSRPPFPRGVIKRGLDRVDVQLFRGGGATHVVHDSALAVWCPVACSSSRATLRVVLRGGRAGRNHHRDRASRCDGRRLDGLVTQAGKARRETVGAREVRRQVFESTGGPAWHARDHGREACHVSLPPTSLGVRRRRCSTVSCETTSRNSCAMRAKPTRGRFRITSRTSFAVFSHAGTLHADSST